MITVNKILCPIDLTPASEEALRYGVALAAAFDAELIALHCIDGPIVPTESVLTRTRESVATAVEKQTKVGQPVNIRWDPIVLVGDPVDAINTVAAANAVSLIVIRSRRRPKANILLGSTAESICRTAPCPVLVTHGHQREWAGRFTREIDLQRIMVGYDFSDDAELALSYGLALSEEYQAELHLLNVVKSAAKADYPELAGLSLTSQRELNATSERLRNAVPEEAFLWCDVKCVTAEGKPYSEIISYAQEHEIDLICMGVKGSDFGMHALFGSNVDRVLRQSPCPVLIARPLKPAMLPAGKVTERFAWTY
ncbi:MAG TPA: universal stress protein [Blastocatellia bacterium]|nr:universal stress protein [Blastocatellia bacterium]